VGFTGYVTKQTFVSSKCQVINVEECVTQAAFESFTEEGINPRFVTLGNWCLRLALRTHSGTCQKWMNEWMNNVTINNQPGRRNGATWEGRTIEKIAWECTIANFYTMVLHYGCLISDCLLFTVIKSLSRFLTAHPHTRGHFVQYMQYTLLSNSVKCDHTTSWSEKASTLTLCRNNLPYACKFFVQLYSI